jgi:hypothetical protein
MIFSSCIILFAIGLLVLTIKPPTILRKVSSK